MARKTTRDRVIEIYEDLRAELGRAPKSTEIIAKMGRRKVTSARVRQLLSEANKHAYTYTVKPNKAPIDEPINPERSEIEQLVIANIRRLYRLEMAKDRPRSDIEMAHAGEFSTRADAANSFRRYFNGGHSIGMRAVARFGKAFGVPVHELFRPTDDCEARP